MRKLLCLVHLAVFLTLTDAKTIWAQDATAVCLAMVTDSAHNVSLTTSSSEFLYTIFDNYCKRDGTTKSSSWNAGISAVVGELPVSLTGGSSDTTTAISNFCRNYASTASGSSSSFSSQSNVVQKALDSANQCLTIATKGSTIAYRILTPSTLAINFNIGSGNPLMIRGLSHPADVTCQGSKANGGGVVTYATGVGQSLSSDLGAYSITCTRTGTPSGSSTVYPESGMVVDTNAGGFDIFWPKDTVFPFTDASQIQGALSAINQQLATTTGIAQDSQSKLSAMQTHYADANAHPGSPVAGLEVNGPPHIFLNNSISCPPGTYLSGLNFGWSGTCNSQCNTDGGLLHVITPICKALF
jgi:hypothetical protein